MATAKEKKALKIDPKDLAALHARSKILGKKFDVAPISLSRGGYVGGAVSFGSLGIDLVTGGGNPPGRFVDIYGPSQSGKSTLAFMSTANANASGIPVFYFDHEASADAKYLTALGVDLAEASGDDDSLFIYSQPTAGEQTYRFMHQMLESFPDKNTTDFAPPQALFVVDSLAAMVPEDEDEDPEKQQMAGPARVHSWGIRTVKARLSKKNVTLVATNQLRTKPGVVYGNPEYEPGGQALTFYPDLKLELRGRGKAEMERGRSLRDVVCKVTKNKQFPPFLKIEDMLKIAFGYGFDRYYDGLAYLKLTGQIAFKAGKGGGWTITGMDDYPIINNKTLKTDDLAVELFKNDFRAACSRQMVTGVAFDRLFKNLDFGDMYKYDPENSGVGHDGPEPAHVSEDEAMLAANEARQKFSVADFNAE